MLKSCFSFSPNTFFKAAIERKSESLPTGFYVNRILKCERIVTPHKKNKAIVRRKKKHAFSLSISNSHIAPSLTHPHELSMMGLSCF